MTARLRETYDNQVFNALKEKFQYKNVMEVPKLVKITINMGLGEAKDNAKIIESAVEEIALISEKVHRELQSKTGHAGWRQGYLKRRQHVCFRG